MSRTSRCDAVLVACLSLVILGCGGPRAADVPKSPAQSAAVSSIERVTAATPQRKDLTLTSTQPASIEAFESTPLSPKVAGYVREVLVDIGDRVTAGQVLLRLDAPEMLDERRQKEAELKRAEAEVGQAQTGIVAAESSVASSRAGVTQAEAALARARSVLEQYRSEAARIEELAKSRSVTPQVADESRARLQASEAGEQEAVAGIEAARAKVQESESAVAQAQADRVAAEARREVAAANVAYVETMIGYLELKAPFDGVVTQRNTDTGHFVRASNEGSLPVLAVARTDKLRVFVAIPESEAAFVTSGEQADPAIVSVQALSGRQFPASVTRTAWALDPSNRSLRVEIDLDNTDGQLRPGMYATASMTLDRRELALTVPATALVRDGTQVLVCAIRDGKVVRTAVQTGLRVGDDVEVISGLSDDALIVQLRADTLKDGQPVELNAAAK